MEHDYAQPTHMQTHWNALYFLVVMQMGWSTPNTLSLTKNVSIWLLSFGMMHIQYETYFLHMFQN